MRSIIITDIIYCRDTYTMTYSIRHIIMSVYITIRIIYNLFSSYICKPHSAPNQYSHPRVTCVSMFFRPSVHTVHIAHAYHYWAYCCIRNVHYFMRRSSTRAEICGLCVIFCIIILLYLYIRRAFWIVSCYNTRRGWGKKYYFFVLLFFYIYYTEHAQPRLLAPMYPHWLYEVGNTVHVVLLQSFR